ncbi:MAG: PQQ-like beta-propeller repeat protein [Verrucomicrobiota bacterium]|nr:PQQ-like beta-propeller repeat protein [Verrucomicrobiota bacterium]
MRMLPLLLVAFCAKAAPVDPLAQWGQWRGPLGTGAAPKADPPTKWDKETNMRWKTRIPGQGHASPVVWGEDVFLTTAETVGGKLVVPKQPPGAHNNMDPDHKMLFQVVALSRKTGKFHWQTTVRRAQPHQSTHESGTWASNSPVTDGRHVVASFGSNGLFCLDAATGKVVWQKDLGKMEVKHGHGEGASPALHGDTVVINWDHEGDSFVVALNIATGRELWRQPRDEPTSWSTPIIIEHAGKPQVIISATHAIQAYDLATGRVIWSCGGMPNNVVASPVAQEGIVIAGASYVRKSMLAIDLNGAKGNLTDTNKVLWRRRTGTPYVPSLLLHKGTLYFFHHYQNILSIADARTGKEHGPFRIPLRSVYASPVAAADRIYLTDLSGTTLVLAHGKQAKVLARNELGEPMSASPALVGRELYLRGARHLFCIAEK